MPIDPTRVGGYLTGQSNRIDPTRATPPPGAYQEDDHGAAVPGHVRETATPGEFLDPPRPGIILADCSCGAEYEVPQGDDEYGALEKAHRAHIAAVRP